MKALRNPGEKALLQGRWESSGKNERGKEDWRGGGGATLLLLMHLCLLGKRESDNKDNTDKIHLLD